MKNFYASLLLSSLLLQFISCKKETTIIYDFSKYTRTDINGAIINEADATDWTNDESWTSEESSLMNFSSSVVTSDSTPGAITVYPAYPNPNEGVFMLAMNTEKECKMKTAVVNTEMEVLHYTANRLSGGAAQIAFDFRALTSFHKNENYRLYYAFYTSKDSLYYKGHGDFRIE